MEEITAIRNTWLQRLKSPIVIASIATKLLAILVTIGIINATQSDIGNQILGLLMVLLTTYSDVNNPSNPDGF